MIVPMKHVTLLALAAGEQSALTKLRDLGVMQIVSEARRSVGTAEAADKLESVSRTARMLNTLLPEDDPVFEDNRSSARGQEVVEAAVALMERKLELEMELGTLKQRLSRLAVWGDFKRSLLDELRTKGVDVLLCSGSKDEFSVASKLENISLFVINKGRNKVDFAAVCSGTVPPETVDKLPVFKLAEDDDPASLRRRIVAAETGYNGCCRALEMLSLALPAVEAYCQELREAVEFSRAADAMSEYGEIAVLTGFVPLPEIDKLRSAAQAGGWGLVIRDPREDEDVPVLLRDNGFTRMIRPLFDFLGIAPGYREIDISGGVLIFFTIFYAIIIGDAGYGMLFGAAALLGMRLVKKVPALKMPVRLLLVLSCAAIIWGALCGSWFGMSVIPFTDRPFPALECFRDFASSSAKQANIQFFCFILAVLQLSVGRVWRVFSERKWRAAGQHIGWMLIIWGNFFLTIRLIVYPGEFPKFMYALYGVGLLLVVLCGVNWKQAADIFQFPFDIIGSFTDVLSYIRLFAVALAGACIAGSFNGMAFDLCKVSVWLIPAGALVVLAGHALNIALALLSVLVHAVRLNTLEFSNHTGLSWSGQKFTPFKKGENQK